MIAIGRMMSVNDCEEADVMSMADRPAGQPERPGPRRLTRSRTDRKIAGVCGGFAAYSGIDANIVRLVMVILAAIGGSGVVLYLVAWVIVPVEDVEKAADDDEQLISSSQ
jgi:phage shock protein PspC (stress-responsive transcriptional regulator)